MKCSAGVGGVEEQDQKHRQQAGSYRSARCQGVGGGVPGAFLRVKKKALLSKTFLNLVPRGRLELPLLSKTDFESAASTNSAIRAMAAEYKDEITVGQSGTWRIFDISARLPGPARRTPSCALLTLLSSSLIR